MDSFYYDKFSKCMKDYLITFEELPGFKYVLKTTKEECTNKQITRKQKRIYDKIYKELEYVEEDCDNVEKYTTISSEIIPHTYQQEYFDKVNRELNTSNKCLLKAPTGAGKTFMSFVLSGMNIKHTSEQNIIIFVSPLLKINSQCICDDNLRLLIDKRFTDNKKPFKSYEVNCKHKNKEAIIKSLKSEDNIIFSTTYQSYNKVLNLIDTFNKENNTHIKINFTIYDECHIIKRSYHRLNDNTTINEKYDNIFNHSLYEKKLFLSATPYLYQYQYLDNYKNYLDLYGNMVECINIKKLIDAGHLAPINTFHAVINDNYSDNNIDDNDAEEVVSDTESESNYTQLTEKPDTVESIIKLITNENRKRICVFVNRRNNAYNLAQTIYKLGYKSEYNLKIILYFDNVKTFDKKYYDSNDINDFYKKNKLERRKDDPNFEEIRIIFSCKKMCMGVDAPPIDTIVFADPRMNYAEMCQCIGRGLRVFKYVNGTYKTCAILLFTTQNREFDEMMISYLRYAKEELEFDIQPNMNNASEYSTNKQRKKKEIIKPNDPKPLFKDDGRYEGVKLIDLALFKEFCCGDRDNERKLLQREFEYYKLLVNNNNIKNRTEYYKFAEENNLVSNPNDYFDRYKIWKGWFEFFNIDTTNWIESVEEWRHYCLSNNITPNNYNDKVISDNKLPTEPELVYGNFTNIFTELKVSLRKPKKVIMF
jgi:superfamily II DNA or RNA helicase